MSVIVILKARSFRSMFSYAYCHANPIRFAQEGWLPPTKRASAVKTRMNGLSCGEKNHDNTFSRFDTIPTCDRQTDDRRTEFG